MGLKLVLRNNEKDHEFHRRVIERVEFDAGCRSPKSCHYVINPIGRAMRDRKLSGDTYVDKRISVSGTADLIIQTAREQPADTKHVDGGEQRATSETVFGLAEPARPMVHRNFNQSIARASNESRN